MGIINMKAILFQLVSSETLSAVDYCKIKLI